MDLRSCYFCGTVGDALGRYEVTDGTGVVLCPGCHAKLGRVLDAADETEPVAGFEAAAEVTFDDPSASDDQVDGDEAGATGIDVGGTDADDGAGSTGGDGGSHSTDTTGVGRGSDDGGGSDDTSRHAPTDPDDDAPGELPGLDADARGDVHTYRKALRLLGNREFPMERAAVLDLLTSAYDLGRDESAAVVEFAVDRGLLVEDGSELRRP